MLKTHNRPYTSTDNPYSEAQFKTLKYRPRVPRPVERDCRSCGAAVVRCLVTFAGRLARSGAPGRDAPRRSRRTGSPSASASRCSVLVRWAACVGVCQREAREAQRALRLAAAGRAADVGAGVAVGRVEVQDVDGPGTPCRRRECGRSWPLRAEGAVARSRRRARRRCARARGSSASRALAVLAVLAGEALELGHARGALDQVDAVVVVDGNVHNGDAAGDALGVQRTLAGGNAVTASHRSALKLCVDGRARPVAGLVGGAAGQAGSLGGVANPACPGRAPLIVSQADGERSGRETIFVTGRVNPSLRAHRYLGSLAMARDQNPD